MAVALAIAPRTADAVQGAAASPRPVRNIVFFLVDDMRYDAMGFVGNPLARTPAIDALAGGGVHFRNAFVTTSLCSPSRASFLTGLYAHRHQVLDNVTPMNPDLPTFPRLLQQAGFRTAFVGKWHMGGASDDPRPGFDFWASFRGQGDYFVNRFNINGRREEIREYVTDAITRMSLEWLRAEPGRPFLLYMSHKAVHSAFHPAPRHADALADVPVRLPESAEDSPDNAFRRPRWVLQQRLSWHGVDDFYHKADDRPLRLLIRDYYRSMMAVDESLGALVAALKELGLFDSTLIILAGDNGFLWGEHGLIDKRCMYEESIRIPLVASCPALWGSRARTVDRMVLNLDVCPTILEAAGLDIPPEIQGRSFLQLPDRPDMPWRDAFLYTYFWEEAFPETPTVLGVRTDRHKLMRYHGVWDTDELYDLADDPREMHNRLLVTRRKQVRPDEGYVEVYRDLSRRLDALLEETGALRLPTWTKPGAAPASRPAAE